MIDPNKCLQEIRELYTYLLRSQFYERENVVHLAERIKALDEYMQESRPMPKEWEW